MKDALEVYQTIIWDVLKILVFPPLMASGIITQSDVDQFGITVNEVCASIIATTYFIDRIFRKLTHGPIGNIFRGKP